MKNIKYIVAAAGTYILVQFAGAAELTSPPIPDPKPCRAQLIELFTAVEKDLSAVRAPTAPSVTAIKEALISDGRLTVVGPAVKMVDQYIENRFLESRHEIRGDCKQTGVDILHKTAHPETARSPHPAPALGAPKTR